MSRVQLALNVSDVDEAVAFYSKLFGSEPAKRRPGYANFAIDEPPLKLVLIENPGAVIKKAAPVAKKFLDFAISAEGQGIYAQYGFRPVASVEGVDVGKVKGANDEAAPFPAIDQLFTIDKDFGGWDEVSDKFFDEEDGLVMKAIVAAGHSLE